ncbi:unnamed protein product, partial [Mesorhabditis belari]|uniref:ubiquitinyl hydrolase 1 n=1 Tax=Mesorhabditis belari TaxID=2138241 RepID=A0AAF3FPI5_9BILA
MTILPNRSSDGRKKDLRDIRKNNIIRQRQRETTSGGVGSTRSWNIERIPAEPIGSVHRKKITQERDRTRTNAGNGSSRRSPVHYNSDDEKSSKRSFRVNSELERTFAETLQRERGFLIREIVGDGNCLFRAVAYHVYADEEMHAEVRRLCLNYMEQNRDHFSQFITEDFSGYLARKRKLNIHGNHLEIQACSEMFARPVEIYEYSIDPLNVFHPIRGSPSSQQHPQSPIRLSYHDGCHYNAVYDPQRSTFGVGLGLPGPEPGQADQHLMQDVLMRSETDALEKVMLEDKLRLTDWQLTEDELTHQIAHSSYVESLKTKRKSPTVTRKKNGAVATLDRPRQGNISGSPGPHSSSAMRNENDLRRSASPSPGPSRMPPTNSGLYAELLAMEAMSGFETTDRAEDDLKMTVSPIKNADEKKKDREKHRSARIRQRQRETTNGGERKKMVDRARTNPASATSRLSPVHDNSDDEKSLKSPRPRVDPEEQNRDHFSQFITEDFSEYLARKRAENVHGNHLEIQAISEMYARPVEIYEYNHEPLNVFHPAINPSDDNQQAPLRLSYHDGCHYNAVEDPRCSTFGVGLGLAGPKPGQADKHLIQEILKRSEMDDLERMMLEDKLRYTDLQRTETELMQQIIHASYLDHLKSGCKSPRPASAIKSHKTLSPTRQGYQMKLKGQSPATSRQSSFKKERVETNKAGSKEVGLYEELLALEAITGFGSEVEEVDDDVLTQALLLSREDFLRKQDRDSDPS